MVLAREIWPSDQTEWLIIPKNSQNLAPLNQETQYVTNLGLYLKFSG